MMFFVCRLFAAVCASRRIWLCIGFSIGSKSGPHLVLHWLAGMAGQPGLQQAGHGVARSTLQRMLHLRSQVYSLHHDMIQKLRRTTGSYFQQEGEAGKNKGMQGSQSSASTSPLATALLTLLASFSQASCHKEEMCPANTSADNALDTDKHTTGLMNSFTSALLLVLLGVIITLTVQCMARRCVGTADREEDAASCATTRTTPGAQTPFGRLAQQTQRMTPTKAFAARATPVRWAMPPQNIYITPTGNCYHASVCSSFQGDVKQYRLCSKCTDNHIYASSQPPQAGASSTTEGNDRSGASVIHMHINTGQGLTVLIWKELPVASDIKPRVLLCFTQPAESSYPSSEARAASKADEKG